MNRVTQNGAFVVASGLVAVLADYYLKRWSLGQGRFYLVLGLFVYLVSMSAFAASLRTGPLLTNGAAVVIVNAIGFVFLSRWVFHENITGFQYAGIGLGVVALVLLHL